MCVDWLFFFLCVDSLKSCSFQVCMIRIFFFLNVIDYSNALFMSPNFKTLQLPSPVFGKLA